MKNVDVKIKITNDMLHSANRRGNREAELENKSGFTAVHKVHKSPKNYNRKDKSWKVQ